MQTTVEIENIEEMRRVEGIDDAELRVEIRALKAGDLVKLTFLTSSTTFETVAVRITSIRGSAFRGKLAKRPASARLRRLTGVAIVFTAAHIHSLLKRPDAEE